MKGITSIVIRRSFQLSMVLVARMAGIAHATPDIRGTRLRPLSPNFRINLSIKKTTLDMYPDSSRIAINPNNKAIWGMNIKTPPIPGYDAFGQ